MQGFRSTYSVLNWMAWMTKGGEEEGEDEGFHPCPVMLCCGKLSAVLGLI